MFLVIFHVFQPTQSTHPPPCALPSPVPPHHLDAVVTSLLPEDLLGALTSLLVFLDDLLLRHNCHMVDCLEQSMVIVAGERARRPWVGSPGGRGEGGPMEVGVVDRTEPPGGGVPV